MADAGSRLSQALAELRRQARPDQLAGMARFGLVGAGRLGVSVPALRRLGRALGRDHGLALALWDTGIPDARILASLVAEPGRLTSAQMDLWAHTAEAWDVCDQACNNAFVRSPLAWDRVKAWSQASPEFARRAAFALLACLATHDKRATDAAFAAALELIEQAATDERHFVRKAVNWALRGIGKRNVSLQLLAIERAERIAGLNSRAARWIVADALRELRSPDVAARLAARRAPRPVAEPSPCNDRAGPGSR